MTSASVTGQAQHPPLAQSPLVGPWCDVKERADATPLAAGASWSEIEHSRSSQMILLTSSLAKAWRRPPGWAIWRPAESQRAMSSKSWGGCLAVGRHGWRRRPPLVPWHRGRQIRRPRGQKAFRAGVSCGHARLAHLNPCMRALLNKFRKAHGALEKMGGPEVFQEPGVVKATRFQCALHCIELRLTELQVHFFTALELVRLEFEKTSEVRHFACASSGLKSRP